MGPSLVWRDLQRIVRGTAAFVQYLVSKENVGVAIGLFSAEAGIVVPGHPNRYFLRIANVTREAQDVKLTIDICSLNLPKDPKGHLGYFAKSLRVEPRRSTAIEVHYDWLKKACFIVEDLPSLPDEFWKGRCDLPQVFSVNALLFNSRGTQVDRLTVYQELTG